MTRVGKEMGRNIYVFPFPVDMGGKMGLFPLPYREREFPLISALELFTGFSILSGVEIIYYFNRFLLSLRLKKDDYQTWSVKDKQDSYLENLYNDCAFFHHEKGFQIKLNVCCCCEESFYRATDKKAKTIMCQN